MTWNESREWCAEKGMRQASLKTLNQVQEMLKELKNRLSDISKEEAIIRNRVIYTFIFNV